MKLKVNRRQASHNGKTMDNQLMRRWPTSDERKRGAGFFHETRGDTYICTILKVKTLLSVYLEVANVQLFYGRNFISSFVCGRLAPHEQMNMYKTDLKDYKTEEKTWTII